MAKFRRKPIAFKDVIEAAQWFPTGRAFRGVCCADPVTSCPLNSASDTMKPHVHTSHNGQAVFLEPGDWIIPESNGAGFYPCKPDIFAATYEPASPAVLVPPEG